MPPQKQAAASASNSAPPAVDAPLTKRCDLAQPFQQASNTADSGKDINHVDEDAEEEEEEEEYDDDDDDDDDDEEDDDEEDDDAGESDHAKPKSAFDEKFFSIVDFDFGEDDDDPDFVPENMNINFGDTQDFAEALANATRSTNITGASSSSHVPLPTGMEQQPNNDTMWQQMFASLGPGPQPSMVSGVAPLLESPNSNARRLRSASKNDDASTLQDSMPHMHQYGHDQRARPVSAVGLAREESVATSDRGIRDGEGSIDGSTSGKPKRQRRRLYTPEEALERRREANRECARRQRQKRRLMGERIRHELGRMSTAQGDAKMPTPTEESIVDITHSLVVPRKRGRPPGSKNRATLEEMERNTNQAANEHELSDMRAENRMLRAEMYRLQEDNAKLRAKVLRLEDIFEDMGRRDLMRSAGGRGRGGRGGDRLRDDNYSGQDEDNSRSDDSRGESDDHDLRAGARSHRRITFGANDPASQFLAYKPFDDLIRQNLRKSDRGGRSHRPTRGRARSNASLDHQHHHQRSYQGGQDDDDELDDDDAEDGEDSDKEAAAIHVLAAALQKHQQQRSGKRADVPSSYRRHVQSPSQQESASTSAATPSPADALRDLLRAAVAQGINFAD